MRNRLGRQIIDFRRVGGESIAAPEDAVGGAGAAEGARVIARVTAFDTPL
jgi:hypothetical protein